MAASQEMTVFRNRTKDYSIALTDADGVAINVAATDVLRFKMGHGDGSTPDLEVDDVATANGSVTAWTTTTPAVASIRLAQADLTSLHPMTYRGEALVVDDSETAPANAIKHITMVVVHLIEALGGDIGLT